MDKWTSGRGWAFCALLFLLLLMPAAQCWAQPSLYADPKANAVGDLLTIILAERTAAQRESGYENRSQAGMGGGAGVDGDDLSGRFAVDASFNKQARNHNETVQRDLLQGTITAQIIEVDAGGNLVLRGERHLNVNGVTHLMKVAGRVRPADIRHDNTIFSHQIAEADIEYRRDGMGRKFINPGLFARVGVAAVLGAALFFATQ